MNQKNHNLEKAYEYFYSHRISECYNILRRFYDRIPFDANEEHAEYIGMFLRVMVELGKFRDLPFYRSILESAAAKRDSPYIRYQLACLYIYESPPNYTRAKKILDGIIRSEKDKNLVIKCKLALAYCFSDEGDIVSCRSLIDSVPPMANSPHLRAMVEHWKANVLRYEKRYEESKQVLSKLLEWVSFESDWYVYFLSQQLMGINEVHLGNVLRAIEIRAQLEKMFVKRKYKATIERLNELDREIQRKSGALLFFQPGKRRSIVRFGKSTLQITSEKSSEKFIFLLLMRRFLSKAEIVDRVYGRSYVSGRDDKVLTSLVHIARKRMMSLGLNENPILFEKQGYRLLPDVQIERRYA